MRPAGDEANARTRLTVSPNGRYLLGKDGKATLLARRHRLVKVEGVGPPLALA